MQKGKDSSKKEDKKKKANCSSLGRDTELYVTTQGPNYWQKSYVATDCLG